VLVEVGDLHIDLRDSTIVKIHEIHLTNPGEPGAALVSDVPRGHIFLVETRFLSPRALDPDSVFEWMKKG
jgi:hypothetical protein